MTSRQRTQPYHIVILRFETISLLEEVSGKPRNHTFIVTMSHHTANKQPASNYSMEDILYSLNYRIPLHMYCKPKYFSGQNIIAFCTNQQYF